jgi:hypothetical protein
MRASGNVTEFEIEALLYIISIAIQLAKVAKKLPLMQYQQFASVPP